MYRYFRFLNRPLHRGTGAACLERFFERLHRAERHKSKSVGFPRTGHAPVAIWSSKGRRFVLFP